MSEERNTKQSALPTPVDIGRLAVAARRAQHQANAAARERGISAASNYDDLTAAAREAWDRLTSACDEVLQEECCLHLHGWSLTASLPERALHSWTPIIGYGRPL